MIITFIIAGLIVTVALILEICYQRRRRRIIRSVTSLSRGEDSERDLIYRLVMAGIPSSTIFHDLYMPCKNGHTQIDLVVPTNVGIFVFEVKDFSGWLFGNANQDKWTQVLAYGREKHQFYNPIKKKEGHINALRNSSEQIKQVPIYSIIVFYGSSEVRELTNIPTNCWVLYPREVAYTVKNIINNAPPAPYTNKWEVMHILKSAVENGTNPEVRAAHLQKAQRASYGKYKSTYSYFPSFYRFRRGRIRRF